MLLARGGDGSNYLHIVVMNQLPLSQGLGSMTVLKAQRGLPVWKYFNFELDENG